MLFYKSHLYVGVSSHSLCGDHFVQLVVIKRLNRLFVEVEVLDAEGQSRVDLPSAPDIVGKVVVVIPYEILLQCPFAGLLIEDCSLG